ncbi:MAG: GAF domain-containing sensor histidine kinase [Chloroflexi bacterium]|nr:GAF domain-containing sensor histidine kinase [Chloroflexota bacterium]
MQQSEPSRQTRTLSILLEVSSALASQVRLDDLLGTIISKTTDVLDAERATLFLYDAQHGELWSKTTGQLEIREIRLPVGKGIAGDVARTRAVANIPDAYADPRFDPAVDRRTGYRTRSVLSMPLIGAHDQLVGVIQVLNKHNLTGFDREDEALLRGLTAHICVAIERARMVEAFIEQDRLLEMQNVAKSRMIDHLSHELKTPLAVLAASSGVLQKMAAAQQPERARTIGERVQRAISRLSELQLEASDIADQRNFHEEIILSTLLRRAEDLFDSLADVEGTPHELRLRFARRIAAIYADDDDQVASTLALDTWTSAVVESLRPAFAHRGVRLTLALAACPAVCLPESILFKSFRGLLRNAIEATPDGNEIEVRLRTLHGDVRLEIHDTGVGIDADLQRQLFFGFVHAGSTDDYSSGRPYDFGAGGKGLDLQRIKLLSERHGFQLRFRSQVGVGSTFMLIFPTAIQAIQTPPAGEPEPTDRP